MGVAPSASAVSRLNQTLTEQNAVIGDALYIRNLTPFSGGQDSYSVHVVQSRDVQVAFTTAAAALRSQISRVHAWQLQTCQPTVTILSSVVRLQVHCPFLRLPHITLPGRLLSLRYANNQLVYTVALPADVSPFVVR